MIGGGCLCVANTRTEALDDFCNLLVFVCGDFGLERDPKKGAGEDHFWVFERRGEFSTWHCGRGDGSNTQVLYTPALAAADGGCKIKVETAYE